MSKLLVGPWVGEFGWELMCWQGLARKAASKGDFEEVVVYCPPGHQLLYEDFATEVHEEEGGTQTDCQNCRDYIPSKNFQLEYNNYVHMNPAGLPNVLKTKEQIYVVEDQEFIAFGDQSAPRTDLVIHARNTTKCGTEFRNWSPENWETLVKELELTYNTIWSIGRTGAALHIPGTVDKRDAPLTEIVEILSSAKTVLGPSSGPMHLASLCKAPHVVWCADIKNHRRYQEVWNPLKTPVRMVNISDGWNPCVEAVIDSVELLIDETAQHSNTD